MCLGGSTVVKKKLPIAELGKKSIYQGLGSMYLNVHRKDKFKRKYGRIRVNVGVRGQSSDI
jgi:hypothetical protein